MALFSFIVCRMFMNYYVYVAKSEWIKKKKKILLDSNSLRSCEYEGDGVI